MEKSEAKCIKSSPTKKQSNIMKALMTRQQERINKAIEAISRNPLEGLHIKRLRGTHEGKYRYAVGDGLNAPG